MIMKVYEYDKKRYVVSIILPNIIVMGLIFIYSLYNNFKFIGVNIFTLLLFVSIYTLFNTLISLSYPSKIVDTGSEYQFHAFGRKHVFKKKDIENIKIRELAATRMYIRINNGSILRGRFWIKYSFYSNGEEFNDNIHALEKELNPKSLKYKNHNTKKEIL
ncbi:hypothetical protein GC105_14500 [Alkalibaculum sp. M08DMB]|uniref:Uncharacterized protein n=1 Tax=Alkalibaculum sporogenes TaxID=2655001 RepID=A0A6A7KCB0_9FIRM|nr:hypothetical protein [Alkalibaculum sporogenes]MPW26992.1 hypothetical protein [Alkalibaculum sporogenes]